MSLKIEYREANLQAVLDYFVKGYKDHKKIEHNEWFLDPVKAKVIFKVYLEEAQPTNPVSPAEVPAKSPPIEDAP